MLPAQFLDREQTTAIRFLYYNVTDQELEWIVTHQYKLFPPKFFGRANFCPILNRDFALRVALEPNNWKPGVCNIHTLRFLMCLDRIKLFTNDAIDNDCTRIVVKKNELQRFNSYIVGYIERIGQSNICNPANQLAS